MVILLLVILSFQIPAYAETEESKLKAETFKGLKIRSIGPALMSGRIADIAVHPQHQSTWYVAVGSGNIWKTTNAGTTWTPIFDKYGSYSIGCVSIDPNNPQIIWAGTGENVSGRHVGYGDGVYKSLDSGRTWKNMGLKKSEHIAKILVDPRNSDVVYVAAQGPLWSAGGDRGLYKTVDGGQTWKLILAKGKFTGINHVAMDPRNPDVLYASTHQRFRTVAALINGGPESGIHKTTDGGQTWRKLKKGLPSEEMGSIGLAVSPQNPDVVYATIEQAHRKGGFYRSADMGESWEKRNDYHSGGTGPHYYQEIFACPHKFDRIYQMDVRLHVTEDGGKTFKPVGEKDKHVDNHALAFDLNNPHYLLAGCDGGLYESWDLGKHWKFTANLPVTQFYKVAVDNDTPFYNIYGGTQDNATQGGPSRTDNVQGIRNSDWFITIFADGHQPAVDPENPDIVYSEWQQGNLVRYDRKTGEVVYIQPQPDKGEPAERWNWDSPILISPHSSPRLYYASQRVWRSDDRGDTWTPISGDLSRGQDRLKMAMMGRVWSIDAVWDLLAMSNYGNVTSLAESPLQEGLIYAGTDDGLVQVTEDGGQTWRKIEKFPGVPEFSFINDIKADLFNADTVYVVFDNHKTGNFTPYILKSADRGKNWESITGDLPDRHIVWRIVQDHVRRDLLFVGTEFGIFFTLDGGKKWIKLTGGVPNISFRDLAVQKRENDLIGASFGRGFFVFDDYTPLRTVSEQVLNQDVEFFPVKKTWRYISRRPLGRSGKGSQGSSFFTAPNPPFGAVFTYYLQDPIKTRKQNRQAQEAKTQKKGGDTPYPGWKELSREAQEEAPAIVMTVTDEDGGVVRRITGPVTAGFHRVNWDLRYPATIAADSGRSFFMASGGVLAPPGTYTVTMAKRVDGVLTDLDKSQTFQVEPMTSGTLPGKDPVETTAFLRNVGELQRAISGADAAIKETFGRLKSIKKALLRSSVKESSLDDETRALEKRLYALREMLTGNTQTRRMGEPIPPSITRRLQVVLMGNAHSTYGPTNTHHRSFEIAREEFTDAQAKLHKLIDVDLSALEEKLEAAGVPWTPGRKVPVLKK